MFYTFSVNLDTTRRQQCSIAGGANEAGLDVDPSQTDGGNDSPYMPTDEDMGIARRPRLHADDVARDQWDRPIEFSFGRQWDSVGPCWLRQRAPRPRPPEPTLPPTIPQMEAHLDDLFEKAREESGPSSSSTQLTNFVPSSDPLPSM